RLSDPDQVARVRASAPELKDYFRLAALGQALARERRPFRVVVVTVGSQRIDATDDRLGAEAALTTALARVIAYECPGVTTLRLDMDQSYGDPQTARLICDEVNRGSSSEDVSYRHGNRWERALVPIRGDNRQADIGGLNNGPWLITGGTGGIGAEIAATLAGLGVTRFALIGRTPLPPREEWAGRVVAAPDTDMSRRIARVRRLEKLGADVALLTADVSSLDAMRAAVNAVRDRWGPIRGGGQSAWGMGY